MSSQFAGCMNVRYMRRSTGSEVYDGECIIHSQNVVTVVASREKINRSN